MLENMILMALKLKYGKLDSIVIALKRFKYFCKHP